MTKDIQPQVPGAIPAVDNHENRSNVFDLMQVVAENLRTLIFVPLAVGVIALGVSFLISPVYTARATFLPPQQQQSMASSLLQSLGSLGGIAGVASGLKNPTDQYISFLKSNSVEDQLVHRFKLLDRYDVKYLADARKVLEKNTRIVAGKDNIVLVDFEDRDAATAAQVANAYGEELTKLLSRLSVTEAQQRREFFGKQLAATKDSLIRAEQSLAATGVSIATLNSNPATALAGPATLRAQVTAQEVKMASMRSYLADAAPEFRQAQAELTALRSELAKAESAQPPPTPGKSDYIAKYRDYKYQETLLDLFARQYEIARIDESREGAVLQIVDVAQAPERKSGPGKAIIAVISTLATGFFVLIFIFLRNAWREAMINGDTSQQIHQLGRTLRRSLGLG